MTAYVWWDGRDVRCTVEDDGPRRDADCGGVVLDDWQEQIDGRWVQLDFDALTPQEQDSLTQAMLEGRSG